MHLAPVEVKGAKMEIVDVTTGEKPAVVVQLTDNIIQLKPFSVCVVKY